MCVRLVSAVERDDESRLQQLLSSLAQQQQQQPRSEGSSGVIMQLAKCLYIAAARGHLRCARLLVDAGAQPNIRGDTNGNTPLVRTLYVTVTVSSIPSVCLSVCLSPLHYTPCPPPPAAAVTSADEVMFYPASKNYLT